MLQIKLAYATGAVILSIGAMYLGAASEALTGETHLKLSEVIGVVAVIVCFVWAAGGKLTKLDDTIAEHGRDIKNLSDKINTLACIRNSTLTNSSLLLGCSDSQVVKDKKEKEKGKKQHE